jgi:F0F1-type ATP synthase assembly protein I
MKKEKPEEPEKKENAAPEEANVGNYMAEGMCFGLALGLIFGQAVFHNLALGMCMGLSIGMLFGMSVKKPKKEKAEEEKKEKENENHAEN